LHRSGLKANAKWGRWGDSWTQRATLAKSGEKNTFLKGIQKKRAQQQKASPHKEAPRLKRSIRPPIKKTRGIVSPSGDQKGAGYEAKKEDLSNRKLIQRDVELVD